MKQTKNYEVYMSLLNDRLVSNEEFYNSKFWTQIKQHYPNFKLNDNVFRANITSMCLESVPEQIRIRKDAFLKKAYLHLDAFLFVSFKDLEDKNIYHFIISSKWFEKYDKKIDVSNSFINFKYNDLVTYSRSVGYHYKRLKNDRTKYIFLIVKDNDFEISKFNEYYELSLNSNKNPSWSIMSNHSNDPQIPNIIKKQLYELSNYSCIIHKQNQLACRTKIDWQATKKALIGTNLNVPLDFHHFIPRSVFKQNFIKNENEDELNWDSVHSIQNIIPLCQICHQSIHNKDKTLVLETFNNIINALNNEHILNEFMLYLSNTNIFKTIEDLKNYYVRKD